MPRREINGGPGRTRTFDLPIMRPAWRVFKPTGTALCRHLVGKPIPVPLPLVRSKHALTQVWLVNSIQLLQTASSPYRLPCLAIMIGS